MMQLVFGAWLRVGWVQLDRSEIFWQSVAGGAGGVAWTAGNGSGAAAGVCSLNIAELS